MSIPFHQLRQKISGRRMLWRLPLLTMLLLQLCSPAAAERLTFGGVLEQGLQHSYALKIARSDLALSQLELKEARSLYLPTMGVRYDQGYAWALSDGQAVVPIGESFSATDLSTWQNSMSFSAYLLLYDFGARGQKLARARHLIRGAEFGQEEQLHQVRSALVDAYAQGLEAQLQLQALERIVDRRKEVFRILERLRVAGVADRAQVEDTALRLAAELTRLDDARAEQVRTLAVLAELTGGSYPAGEVELAPLPEAPTGSGKAIPVEQLPQIRALDEEMARFRAERSAAKREMLPTVGFSGNYRMYGANRSGPGPTMEDLGARDAMAMVVLQWEFFSGFRDRLQLAKLDEQINRLSLERQQRIAELRREVGSLQEAVRLSRGGRDHLGQRRQSIAAIGEANHRLREQGVLDQVAALERETDLIEETLDADLIRTRQHADAIRLQFWEIAGAP
ncbi:MAG: TolC family protein [Desulfobacteraceae bacterium]|nr:TolC family protein [Desulfobacteraceae bacterium]